MITKEQMLQLLVEACPSFSEKWQKHKQEYGDEEAHLPYVALGEFAQHLIELAEVGQTSEFEKVFKVVEHLHVQGDNFVKEAATIGLLEELQNIVGKDVEKFVQYLHPVSAKYWKELNSF